jgi:hypothetical protein
MAWLGLDEEAFAGRVARLSESKRPTAKALQELGAFQQKARARQIEVLTRQLELERRLAVLVEDAYGLTPGERHLLHATRPIRDPLDVLESKIRGRSQTTDEPETGDQRPQRLLCSPVFRRKAAAGILRPALFRLKPGLRATCWPP